MASNSWRMRFSNRYQSDLQQVGTRVDACQRVDRVGEPVLGFLELDDRLNGLQVIGVARQDRLEMPETCSGVELAEHELGELSPAGGRADQVELFGLAGRAVDAADTMPLNTTVSTTSSAAATHKHSRIVRSAT